MEENAISNKIKRLATEIKIYIGANERLTSSDGTRLVNFIQVSTRRIDSKRLKEEVPDIYNKYTTYTTSRQFRPYYENI